MRHFLFSAGGYARRVEEGGRASPRSGPDESIPALWCRLNCAAGWPLQGLNSVWNEEMIMKKQVNRKRNPVAPVMAGASARRYTGPHSTSAKTVQRISQAEFRQSVRGLVYGEGECDVERH